MIIMHQGMKSLLFRFFSVGYCIFLFFNFPLTAFSEKNSLDQSKEYWDVYYQSNICPQKNSSFAHICFPLIPKNQILLELGCGNARDAFFFARKGVHVIACELSQTTILSLCRKNNLSNLTFISADFTDLKNTFEKEKIGAVYSRFTMHAISEEKASATYQWSFRNLEKGGLLLIEARTIHDDLFGKGKRVGRNAFFTDYYRRFLVLSELTQELEEIGFQIEHAVESRGLSVVQDDDPSLLRVIARKP